MATYAQCDVTAPVFVKERKRLQHMQVSRPVCDARTTTLSTGSSWTYACDLFVWVSREDLASHCAPLDASVLCFHEPVLLHAALKREIDCTTTY